MPVAAQGQAVAHMLDLISVCQTLLDTFFKRMRIMGHLRRRSVRVRLKLLARLCWHFLAVLCLVSLFAYTAYTLK